MAARRLSKYGKNVITPPPKNLPKRIFWYIFGGFGSLLVGGSAICFISWKPLGEPNPQASNLALALVLLVVVSAQAFFNAWQGEHRVLTFIAELLADFLPRRLHHWQGHVVHHRYASLRGPRLSRWQHLQVSLAEEDGISS